MPVSNPHGANVICSITSIGLEMPPDQKAFQIWSIWLLMGPVIMLTPSPFHVGDGPPAGGCRALNADPCIGILARQAVLEDEHGVEVRVGRPQGDTVEDMACSGG